VKPFGKGRGTSVAPIVIADQDPSWPALFASLAYTVMAALRPLLVLSRAA
jgi:hypothetical protein